MLFGRKTREPRRKTDDPAWIVIDGGFGVIRCQLQNISKSGAQLRVDKPEALPKSFTLTLRQNERTGRRCRIAWRLGSKVGVKFEQ